MIDNFEFAEYVAYFRDIAQKHTAILHGSNDLKRFVRMNIEEAFAQITDLSTPLLALQSIEYSTQAVSMDQNLRNIRGGFLILKSVPEGEFSLEDDALNFCMEIQTDIEARMRRDKKGCDFKWMKHLDVSSFHCYKVGPLYNNSFGWLCEFEIKSPLNLSYNPAKWQS